MSDAEEWAIDNHADFAGFEPHDNHNLDTLSRVAHGIATYGEAFSAYLGWAGTSQDAINDFHSHDVGTYDWATAWATEVVNELGCAKQRKEHINPLDPTVCQHQLHGVRARHGPRLAHR